jgi:cytochrome c oxidase assembly factor CtaG
MHAQGAMHAGHALDALREWGGDPSSVVALGAMAGSYAFGTRQVWLRAGVGRGVRSTQVACFAAALGVLALALLSPIDALSSVLFSAHMTQHVLLAVVAPPLIVLGAPTVAMLFALPERARRRVPAVTRHPFVLTAWRFVSEPLVACALHAAALWMWHAPRLYVAALDNGVVHFAEHASFVGTGVVLWWSILRPRAPRRSAYATGIVVLFLTALQSGALGALLTFSPTLWFPAQGAGAEWFSMTRLQDQQLAGLIMWVPGGLLYTAAMGVLFAAWMRHLDRASPAAPVVAAP